MWMWSPGIPQYFPLSNPRNSSCLPTQALEILRPNSAFLGSDLHCDLLDCWDPCQLCNAAIRTPLLICLIGQWVVSDSSFGFWETPMKKDDIFEYNQRQSTTPSYTAHTAAEAIVCHLKYKFYKTWIRILDRWEFLGEKICLWGLHKFNRIFFFKYIS